MANDGFGENGLKYRFFKTWQLDRTIYSMRNHCEHVWLLGTQQIQSPPSKIFRVGVPPDPLHVNAFDTYFMPSAFTPAAFIQESGRFEPGV